MSILNWLQGTFSKPPCRRRASYAKAYLNQRPDSETLEVRQLLAAQVIVVRDSDVTVIEGRQNAGRLDVRLFAPPAADVQITAARVGGDSDITVNNSVLVFTPTNWDTSQSIMLSAAEDADQANGTATIRLAASGLPPVDATVQERDNDRLLGIEFEKIDSIESTSVTVPEARTATILVRLTADPHGQQSVSVQRSSGDASLEVIRGSQLTFDPSNWERFQPVVVSAASDSDTVDGTATLSFVSATLPMRTMTATERDDDIPSRLIRTVALVDDFAAKPLIEEQINNQEFSYINRLGGDRGEIYNAGQGQVDWGDGFVEARVLANNVAEFAGVAESLNLIQSEQRPVNLHAILPAPIVSAYQLRATAILIEVEDGQGTFQVELQTPQNTQRFVQQTLLTGGKRSLRFDLPSSGLTVIQKLNWIIKGPVGNFARVTQVSLELEGADPGPLDAFIAAYVPLLNNFDAAAGLTRDRANFPSGFFDNVSASGLQALTATVAHQLGVINLASAQSIVQKTTDALLTLPRLHGIMRHFVGTGSNTEYSSVDTIIAWLSLHQARRTLGMDTAAVEQAFRDMDWTGSNGLILPDGTISHGYDADGQRLPSSWATFGCETYLAILGFAMSRPGSALPNVSTFVPPTDNGSGFIDELAWLFVPSPAIDVWGTNWNAYRTSASQAQATDSIYQATIGPIFGASAGEQAEIWNASIKGVYQAYGLGGRYTSRNDGTQVYGEPVAAPHYAAMAAELQPQVANIMFDFLMQRGLMTPLNAVESIYLTQDVGMEPHWNSLKGSWNLGLTALGLGKQLLGSANYGPYVAARSSAFVQQALQELALPMLPPTITSPPAVTPIQRPQITWNSVPGAIEYEIWVTKDPGTSPYHQATVSQTSYTPNMDFGIGKFNLWVRAKYGDIAGPWSPKYKFRINTSASIHSIPRMQPTLRPTIGWDALPGAVKYDVWVNDVSRNIIQKIRDINVTGTSFTPSADLPLGVYRAWVRGIAVDGTAAAWSGMTEFVTMQAPTITQGQNSTFDRTPTFAWNSLPGAATYEVFIRDNYTGQTTLHEKNITSLSFTPSIPLPDGPYRWWSIGVSAQGVRSFWTAPMDIYIGGRTDLLAPVGSSGNRTPTFIWRPVDGAVRYDLFVNLDGGQAQIIRQQNLTATSYTPGNLLPTGEFRAWIRAVSTSGEVGPWSLVAEFTIAVVPHADTNSSPGITGLLVAVLPSEVPVGIREFGAARSLTGIVVVEEAPLIEVSPNIDGSRPAWLPVSPEDIEADPSDEDLLMLVVNALLPVRTTLSPTSRLSPNDSSMNLPAWMVRRVSPSGSSDLISQVVVRREFDHCQ